MTPRKAEGGAKTLPMTVKNTGFLLDRLGQDCHPLQFLRELTHNSIQAIERAGGTGQIIWDVDWTKFDLDGTMKLCVIDTGDGMTGPEMVEHINKLSSSGAEQSLSGNYGVGAKIAAATRNHEGLIYLSWKQGQGCMIHLWRNPDDGIYGLRQQRHSDGTFCDFLEIDDAIKPEAIKEHGTMIVLLGNSDDQKTIEPPQGSAGPSRWIAKYLNTRYFSLPETITLQAREGWQNPRTDKDRNLLRTLTGQKKYLDKHSEKSGTIKLDPPAKAHWWILKDEPAISSNSGFIESSGHVAALYQNELFEISTSRSGTAKLQQFGIIFGTRFVTIYLEPSGKGDSNVTTNTARTNLLINSEPLPWVDWAASFRDNMPPELDQFIQEKAASASNTDHTKSIRDRLKPLLDLFKVTRYRPSPSGEFEIDENLVHGGIPRSDSNSTGTASDTRRGSGKQGGMLGNIYSLFEKRNGTRGDRVQPDPFPQVQWISKVDKTREVGDLEDRAARYLEHQNLLLINADFRVFGDMVTRWHKEVGGAASTKKTVEDVVRGWFEQALVETVIGIQALKGAKEWSTDDLSKALSDESLTSAVMQRYHINYNVKRELGAKLGKICS